MDRRSKLRVVVAAAGLTLTATAAALDPREFVAGWFIEAPADADVFDVALTADVYAAAGSIEQLAVLDANDEPQSFFGRSAAEPVERRVVLEATPLYATAFQHGLIVGVVRGDRSTSVNVASDGPAPSVVTAFVLDARDVNAAPVALELDWRALPQPFLLDVVVEQSMDLQSWRSVGTSTVATLSVGGTEARQTRVPVRARAGGYFRVTPRGAVDDWLLERVTLVIATAEPPATASVLVQPLAASEVPEGGAAGALYFDAGGSLPVSRVTFEFGGDDGWLRADVAASRSLGGPWAPVAYGELFYALSFEGRDFENAPLDVGRHDARYWRVLPFGAPPRDQPLTMRLEFQQERLRVAAGGVPPYRLAAGTLVKEAGPDATLEQVWSRLDRPAADVPLATLLPRHELGGPDALVPSFRFPWRTASLWSVLIVGVLVVGAMAVRLA